MKFLFLPLVSFVIVACQGLPNSQTLKDLVEAEVSLTDINFSKPAEIEFISPAPESTDIKGMTPITFLWQEPVLALQNQPKAKAFLAKYLTLSPAHKGEWRTLGSSGIMFQPAKPWTPSTHYSLRANSAVLADFTYSFETERLAFKSHSQEALVAQKPLILYFNQEVSLEALKEGIGFKSEKNTKINISYGSSTNEDGKKIVDKHILELTPQAAWPEDITYELSIAAMGQYSLHGLLPIEKNLTLQFTTAGPLSLVKFEPPLFHQRSAVFTFSSPVSSKVFAENLILTPAPETPLLEGALKYWVENDYESLNFYLPPPDKAWDPKKSYEISLKPQFKDVVGRSLEVPVNLKFQAELDTFFSPVYWPNGYTVFERTAVFEPTFAYGGNTLQVRVTLNNNTKTFPLLGSKTDRQIWTLDLKSEFPEIFNDNGELIPGDYRLKVVTDFAEEDRFVSYETRFFVSDFSVEVKQSASDKVQVFAQPFPGQTELETPLAMEFFVGDWQSERRLTTVDSVQNGHELVIPDDAFRLVKVQSGDKIGFGSPNFNQGMSPWDTQAEFGAWQYDQLFSGALLTDRPLYKPAQTVFFKGLLREVERFGKTFPLKSVEANSANFNYELVVFDPQYNEIDRITGTTQTSSFDGQFDLSETVALGNYRLVFNLLDGEGNPTFSMETPFWVQEYQKPNFLIQAEFSNSTALAEENLKANLQAQYAFGGALVGKPLQYTVTLFGNEPCLFWCWGPQNRKDKLVTTGEGVLNESGEFKVDIDLKDIDLENIDWNLLTLNATIEVSPAEQSSVEISVPFARANFALELENMPYFLAPQAKTSLRGTVKNLAGDMVSATPLKLRLLQIIWVRNERKNADGNFYGEWESVETELRTLQSRTNEKGEFEFDFTAPNSGGEYTLEFIVQDEKGRSQTIQNHFWVSGNDLDQVRKNNTNHILRLFPDKDVYRIGERVEMFAPNPDLKPSRVHATLERGEVLETLEFNPETSTVSFLVEDWMSPNVFVSVLMEGLDETGEMQVKWGAHPIKITDPSRELQIKVTPEKAVYRPGDEVKLSIETLVDNQGQPAEVTLAVVDQTLLALKAREPLNLMETLIGNWPLGVTTTHTLANFMSAAEMTAIREEVRKIADRMELGFGGGGGKGDNFKPRGDFKDTAEFVAKFQTNQTGQGTYSFILPDNLTVWDIFAVGATSNNSFGTTESNFQVSLPLLISEIVPSFFRAGDELELGLLVYRDNTDLAAEEIKVTLNMPDEIEVIGETTKTVVVEKEARVYFKVRVKPSRETKTIRWGYTVESAVSGLVDAVTLEKDILPPAITLSVADFQRVENQYEIKLVPDANAINSSVKVKVFASLAQALQTLIETAKKSDYGTTEHRLSLLVSKLYQTELEARLNREIQPVSQTEKEETRDFISKSYTDGGGFAFWPEARAPNFWVTTQVLEYAPLLAANNIALDQNQIDASVTWLRTELFKTCDEAMDYNCPDAISRVQAASVLAKFNQLTVNDLEFLTGFTQSLEAKVRWLETAQTLGEVPPSLQAARDEYLTAIEQAYNREDRYGFWSEEAEFKAFYSQNERLTALILQTLMTDNFFGHEYEMIARYLSESRKEHLSINSSLEVLKALVSYIETQEKATPGAQFTFQNNTTNTVLLDETLENADQIESYQTELTSDSPQTFVIATTEPLLFDFELTETLPASLIDSNARGFWIERQINQLQGLEPINSSVGTWRLGENYVVKLRIVTARDHRHVVVEDPIPSGTEIINFDFDNTDQTLENVLRDDPCPWGWCEPLLSHKEYRQDRARFFIDYLPAGSHEITYLLRPRLTGEFDWLPAEAKEIYFPEVAANTAGKRIKIQK